MLTINNFDLHMNICHDGVIEEGAQWHYFKGWFYLRFIVFLFDNILIFFFNFTNKFAFKTTG